MKPKKSPFELEFCEKVVMKKSYPFVSTWSKRDALFIMIKNILGLQLSGENSSLWRATSCKKAEG
jgi:hypothetical protein